jgi:hypothetical protein
MKLVSIDPLELCWESCRRRGNLVTLFDGDDVEAQRAAAADILVEALSRGLLPRRDGTNLGWLDWTTWYREEVYIDSRKGIGVNLFAKRMARREAVIVMSMFKQLGVQKKLSARLLAKNYPVETRKLIELSKHAARTFPGIAKDIIHAGTCMRLYLSYAIPSHESVHPAERRKRLGKMRGALERCVEERGGAYHELASEPPGFRGAI